MLAPLHRLLLPCLNGLDTTGRQYSSSSSQQWPDRPAGAQHQSEHPDDAAKQLQPLPQSQLTHVSQLSTQQKQELKQAVIGSFKQDPQAASRLLAKSLSGDARRQLMAALEASQEPPGLSRTAMVDTPDNHGSSSSSNTTAAAGAEGPAREDGSQEVPEPSFKQLLRVGVTKGLPFVAFGFFDNLIMITAGEQIDLMFGAKLGLSSMMAAGLGNTVADVVGINISHSIERRFKDMKTMAPALTKAQLALPRTQRAKWLGCAIGMASGCLLGLVPLLFYDPGTGGHQSSSSRGEAAAEPATAGA